MTLAHIGHWYAELAYVVPVLSVVAFLGIQNRRDKRAERLGRTPVADGEGPDRTPTA